MKIKIPIYLLIIILILSFCPSCSHGGGIYPTPMNPNANENIPPNDSELSSPGDEVESSYTIRNKVSFDAFINQLRGKKIVNLLPSLYIYKEPTQLGTYLNASFETTLYKNDESDLVTTAGYLGDLLCTYLYQVNENTYYLKINLKEINHQNKIDKHSLSYKLKANTETIYTYSIYLNDTYEIASITVGIYSAETSKAKTFYQSSLLPKVTAYLEDYITNYTLINFN